jgi:hypothetical protein
MKLDLSNKNLKKLDYLFLKQLLQSIDLVSRGGNGGASEEEEADVDVDAATADDDESPERFIQTIIINNNLLSKLENLEQFVNLKNVTASWLLFLCRWLFFEILILNLRTAIARQQSSGRDTTGEQACQLGISQFAQQFAHKPRLLQATETSSLAECVGKSDQESRLSQVQHQPSLHRCEWKLHQLIERP